jgi:hypothetical protein
MDEDRHWHPIAVVFDLGSIRMSVKLARVDIQLPRYVRSVLRITCHVSCNYS